ncbi:MAG: stage III sporulation protein AF [Oscillospiraceae bacterium]|jgi:stage III sporulation protein AF
MAEGIRDWLVGIIAAAMLAALTGCITPKGTIGKIGRMVGGLVLMLCLLRPVAGIDLTSFSQTLTAYRAESGGYSAELEETNEQLRKTIIEEKSAAYSEEQANAMGITCRVNVLCQTGKDGTPYPYEALVIGHLSAGEREKMQRMLESDLAIAPEKVYWKTEEP